MGGSTDDDAEDASEIFGQDASGREVREWELRIEADGFNPMKG